MSLLVALTITQFEMKTYPMFYVEKVFKVLLNLSFTNYVQFRKGVHVWVEHLLEVQ